MTSVYMAVMLYADHPLKSIQPTIRGFSTGPGLAMPCQGLMTCRGQPHIVVLLGSRAEHSNPITASSCVAQSLRFQLSALL